MTGPAADTDLLLVHADELEPVLGSVSSRDAGRGEISAEVIEQPQYLWDDTHDANALDRQRWGVVAPEGPRGDELLGRIDALVRRRREQQGGHEVTVYRVPPGQDAAEASRWRKRVFEAPGVRRRELPRYLLVLGDLDEVSAELQVSLGAEGFVGRLPFTHAQDYEAYVDKLLRWEGRPAEITRARAVFHTVHDRTSATTVGHRVLMKPGLELARAYQASGELRASELYELEHGYTPKPGPLLQEAAKAEPGLLFTMSHGAGAPRQGWRSGEEQRQLQGGMSFGRSGGLLTAEALEGRPFMPGGVWFMLACFGAGTPSHSKYEAWLRDLQQAGHFQGNVGAVAESLPADGRPFIAALPKTVLAGADGPIAFMGHVDLAWTYSFRELDDGAPVDRPDRFVDVFEGLLRRDRVGVAFRELLRHYGRANTELTTLDESGVTDVERRGHLWMLRNDLAGYLLLGDPAARLPLRDEARPELVHSAAALPSVVQSTEMARPRLVVESTEMAPPTEVTPLRPGDGEAFSLPASVEPERLERAIGLFLAGEMGSNRILRECELPLSRREFEELVERYAAAGRRAIGLRID